MKESQLTVTEEPPPEPQPRHQVSIVRAGDRGVQFSTLGEIGKFAVVAVNSGIYKDLPSPEVAIIKIQAGLELGLSPVWSLTNIMLTNGRPSVWGDALLGLVLGNPLCEDVIETSSGKFPDDNYTATCEVRRKGRAPVVRSFSVADAKKAGIFGKNVHGQYPTRMLQMRARAFACRDAFADALRGLGVQEEQEDIPRAKVRELPSAPADLKFSDEPEVIEAPAPKVSPTELADEVLFK